MRITAKMVAVRKNKIKFIVRDLNTGRVFGMYNRRV